MSVKISSFIKPTGNTCTGCVIFCHGSGDTGPGVLEWIKSLVGDFAFPHLKIIFPTAPLQPYTPLSGELSNVWFDRHDITPEAPEYVESIKSICAELEKFIKQEIVGNGIPLNRIIIGGFSMGGALSLYSAYKFIPGFAGVFALSSLLNNDSVIYKNLGSGSTTLSTPLFWCHGERDPLVPFSCGQQAYKRLCDLGVKGEFVPLKNTFHELKKVELNRLSEWILKILPPK